jgi:hypothetical protein
MIELCVMDLCFGRLSWDHALGVTCGIWVEHFVFGILEMLHQLRAMNNGLMDE